MEGERGNLKLRLTDGVVLEAATVVVGIGAEPNDGWLRSSGLVVDNGLVCDEHCRAVEAENIYGVGDVARWFHPRHGTDVRVEHWTNAVDQAACVAHNIVHPDDLRAYAPVEYVWSDQHDWKVQVVGRAGGNSRHVMVGDPAQDNRFVALYSEDQQRLSGAAIVNWPRALIECRRAMSVGGSLAEVRSKIVAQKTKQETKTR
ncbi:MAG: FAD-dependent oxidoreductase [Pseudonocardia sp.]